MLSCNRLKVRAAHFDLIPRAQTVPIHLSISTCILKLYIIYNLNRNLSIGGFLQHAALRANS